MVTKEQYARPAVRWPRPRDNKRKRAVDWSRNKRQEIFFLLSLRNALIVITSFDGHNAVGERIGCRAGEKERRGGKTARGGERGMG